MHLFGGVVNLRERFSNPDSPDFDHRPSSNVRVLVHALSVTFITIPAFYNVASVFMGLYRVFSFSQTQR